ncbi:MAG: YfdX family protein [Chromatiales bacterium]|nr:YfdX family protein [Chromatiales bacterium]
MAERAKVRDAAIAQAKEHPQNGDQQAAAQSLKLADLTLIAHEISLPLAETSAEVDQAIKLLDAGKPYEANLELKKVRDGLVVTTAVVGGPTDPVSPAGSGSETSDGQS